MTLWRDELRAAGLRVTQARLAVLTEVGESPHSAVDAIIAGARARIGSLSVQAVYDVVYALTKAGLLRRIEPAGSPARYELDTGDNHHHAVCRECGAIVDVVCDARSAPCLRVHTETGFEFDEAEVTFWGICPECRISNSTTDRRFA
ncbi:transcriptional repressor [Mycobacterium dioxanotrophicus]|uniref:Transcriptional repressor n=1 Tax=Mycobacterium dioxanotrophicus TaxID=482462 RepID=A0A1Y0BZV8_9MYCO|nr:Fur family transcriptional regulator [Mycobacterium dioxanotrophicus]ART68432.1 transcriptional repressor [Mycobacterium dioxanotrophicus]